MKTLLSRILPFLMCCLWMAAATSCHKDSDPDDKTQRTVLVYMVANNSLGQSRFDSEDLSEMQQAALSGHLGKRGRLLVYHHPYGDSPVLLEITAKGERQLKTYGDDIYSTSPERLREVLADVSAEAPAEGYGIVFWSHADGWLNGTNPADGRYKAFGDDRSHYMKLTTLADALSGRRFDFVYFDCCLMANIETAWELRGVTPYIIGSATELSVHGMPYHRTLRHLFAATPDVEAAARTTYEYYDEMQSASTGVCQISVIATAGLPALADASAELLATQTSWPGSLSGVQSMSVPGKTTYYVDMADYYRVLAEQSGAEATFKKWEQALAAAVPAAFTTAYGIGGLKVDKHCGLATYPIASAASLTTRGYNTCAWYADVISKVPLYAAAL